MRSLRPLALVLVALSTALPSARGQNHVFEDAGIYCNSGLRPDGYVDFSGLPPGPATSNWGMPGPKVTDPVTATLPVSGIPGLTVQVSIPALSNPVAPTAYTANGADLQFNGLPNPTLGPPNLLTLTFSQPINGVGLEIGNLVGRFSYKYALLVGDGSANNILPFENSAQGYTLDLLTPRSENLQLVGLDTTFTTVTVAFSGDPGEGLQSPIISNLRVQSSSAANSAQSIPTDGLQQWLRIGDAGSIVSSGGLVWKDQSGNGHDATATPGHQPTLVAQGRSCRGTWRFDGSSSFDFNLPISGWSEMTVFLVGRSTKDPAPDSYESFSAAMLWNENAQWGNTFISPYQSHVFARFGTSKPNTNLDYIRPGAGIGGDFTITRAVHNHEVDNLFVNGTKVLSHRGNYPVLGGSTGDGTIGKGVNDTYFNGEISEILVYNRALSAREVEQVETYLRQKFGID